MVRSSHAKRFSNGCLIAFLATGLIVFGCKKKEEPNVTYDSQSESSGSGGKGSVSESDLSEGGAKGGGSSGSMAGMQTVYFDYDSSNLSAGARKGIEANAKKMKAEKNLNVTVEGNCDERGATQYNLALGERRANSVRDYMVNLGVAKARIKTISYGEERPAVVGSDESAYAKNRRADFTSNR